MAGGGPAVAVVAEEDYCCGLELGLVDCEFEIGPEVLQLCDVAVDVADADY